MELIESILNTEDPLAAPIFEQFSVYWQRSRPKLYHYPEVTEPFRASISF